MFKLEILLSFERLNKNLTILQQRFPHLRIIIRSSFFVIVGCYIQSQLTEEEKTYLRAMIDAKVIRDFRCKEREDR